MTAPTMAAFAVDVPGPIDAHRLVEVEKPIPEPGRGQVRVRVLTCGVCRTDLHLAEGDLEPKRALTVPGHEVVGIVDRLGPATGGRFAVGDRVGVAWLAQTCGVCRFCAAGQENLCMAPAFTGWDRDGGYGEFAIADEAYAYALPGGFDEQTAAPLLCAGIIGYRALRRAELPERGRLGLYGFGASAHIAAQVALAEGATVHVLTRSAEARSLALELGAASAGEAADSPPEPLDSAILFAPAGELVPVCLEALERGGTLAIAGIHLSDIPSLNYERHLFEERTIRSVTANTRRDGEEFLGLASQIGIRVATTPYLLARANEALFDLAHGQVNGAAVLRVSEGST
jgi:propanol-preferring alcohol dehydrogenase